MEKQSLQQPNEIGDDIQIVSAGHQHRQGVIRLIKEQFLPREPIEVALNVDWTEAGETMIHEIDEALGQPNSFVAVHPTDGVIGCRLSKLARLQHVRKRSIDDQIFVAMGDSPRLRIMELIFQRLIGGWREEMMEKGIFTVLQFIDLCVDERYAGRGIAKRLVDESMRLAQRLKVDAVYAVATNHVSQRVLGKAGFVAWRSLDYAEILDEQTGQPYVLPADGSRSIKWMVKTLIRQPAPG